LIILKTPIIVDTSDHKWILLMKILGVLETRRCRQEIAKFGVKPANQAYTNLAIVLLSMFFSVEISYAIKEIEKRIELQQFLRIDNIPTPNGVYRFMSQFSAEQFISMTHGILNAVCPKKRHYFRKTIIIDGTSLSVDINWFRKRIQKSKLVNKPYKWQYSPSKGFYIGLKLTLAIDQNNLLPLAFLVHQNPVADSKIFPLILQELKRRRILHKGDRVLLDRGYYSYKNYVLSLIEYNVIPLILPKKGFLFSKLENHLISPLPWFENKKSYQKVIELSHMKKELKDALENSDELAAQRSIIEDVFKFGKEALNLDNIHRYTSRSLKKSIGLHALLMGLLIHFEFNKKDKLQRASSG